VTALLSDLFGIQARSGCFCAGPYLHRLYGIDDEWSEGMLAQIAAGHEGAKLAFTRVTFSYYTTEAAFEYILNAVHLLADHGWKLLPLYRFDPCSGLWRHRRAAAEPATALLTGLRRPARPLPTAPETVLPGQLLGCRLAVLPRVPAAGDRRHPPQPGPPRRARHDARSAPRVGVCEAQALRLDPGAGDGHRDGDHHQQRHP
jgi:hypothetical protein